MANRYWVGGSGNWDTTTTHWSATSGGTSGASAPGLGDNVFFDQASTYTVTIAAAVTCANMTISAGTPTLNLSTTSSKITITGSVDFTGCLTSTPITGLATSVGIVFGDSTLPGNYTFTFSGRTIGNIPIQIGPTSAVSISWTLQDAVTFQGAITHTRASIVLNNQTLSGTTFTSTSGNSRSIDFGSTGIIASSNGGANCINISSAGNSISGSPTIAITYSGSVATSAFIYTGSSLRLSAGTYTFSSGISQYININFTGFSGTWTISSASISGNMTFSSTMATPSSANTITLNGTSGTQTITSNGKTLDFPIIQNGVGGTVFLADALTMGATRTLTLTNGTFDGNNKTISGASSFSMNGTVSMKNINTALAFTHTSGGLTLTGNCTFGAFTFTAGNINL